jgi:hypothetical protein
MFLVNLPVQQQNRAEQRSRAHRECTTWNQDTQPHLPCCNFNSQLGFRSTTVVSQNTVRVAWSQA